MFEQEVVATKRSSGWQMVMLDLFMGLFAVLLLVVALIPETLLVDVLGSGGALPSGDVVTVQLAADGRLKVGDTVATVDPNEVEKSLLLALAGKKTQQVVLSSQPRVTASQLLETLKRIKAIRLANGRMINVKVSAGQSNDHKHD